MERGIERDNYEDDFFFSCMNVMKMIMNMMKNTCLNYAPSWIPFLLCYI